MKQVFENKQNVVLCRDGCLGQEYCNIKAEKARPVTLLPIPLTGT
jgi:hypothetical protein